MIRSRVISLALCVIGAGLVWFNLSDSVRNGTKAISLLTLAAVGAVIATRGVVRRLIAIVLVFSGLGLILGSTPFSIVGGVIVVIGGTMAVITCPGWPEMGLRYQRAPKVEQTDLWAALDRGEDPTAR
jgi:hypothetical protein